ncbi:MAG TPA: hypothetical protein VFW00_03080 [Rhodocyclaceae bacterium]|nr:hypothetical protein [Rhodocyclaceae bacterium]
MYAIRHFNFSSKLVALAMMTSVAILGGCGGGDKGDPGPGALPDSITISSLNGPSGGQVGQPVSLNVKVVTTGGIADNEITYTWVQTAGTPVVSSSQGDGSHESTLTFTAGVTGTVTYTVTATARGKTASQSKSVPINP